MITNQFNSQLDSVVLTGNDLTIADVINVAKNNVEVRLAPEVKGMIINERELLMKVIRNSPPIYGVTRGVGANKNIEVPQDLISEYQTRILLSHCVGVPPYYSEEIVRAIMVVRANSLAKGGSGVQPEILEMFVNMLNHQIHPLTPSKGSLGTGDLGPLAEMGLAFIGKGEVYYHGVKMKANLALKKAGLKPIILGPKDGLILCSNNSASLGHAALLIYRISSLLDHADIAYALSLEGFRGSITPIDPRINKFRPHQGQINSAMAINDYLENSFLWDEGTQRDVQDPISYRSAIQVHGACRDIFDFLVDGINIEINSMGDNPILLSNEEQLISHGNFHIETAAKRFDFFGIQSSSLANMIQNRIQKLMIPEFSDLPKFLALEPGINNGFTTLQKSYTFFAAEIRHLANPGSLDALSVANGVEDHAAMATFVVQKTEKIIENLELMVGIELMVASQAVDLLNNPILGDGTKIAYECIRNVIPKLKEDRRLRQDIESAHLLIKEGIILKKVMKKSLQHK